MKRIARAIAATTIAASSVAGGLIATASPAQAELTPAQEQEYVTAHNEIRRNTAAAETARTGRQVTIPDLVWSPEAAQVAQAWANQQAAVNGFDHNPNRNGFGENLAGGRRTPTAVVQAWASEVQWYDPDANTCAPPPGESCGHYTQVVWANTTAVGCASAEHPRWGEIHVCNYVGHGNLDGQRPYAFGAQVTPPAPNPPAPNPPAPNPPAEQPPAPAGNPDSFATPTVLAGEMNGTVNGNNRGAGREAGEPRVAGVGNSSVHYSIVAPVTGTLRVSTAGSGYDTVIGVGTGTTAANLTFLGQNDDANGTFQSEVTVDVVAGRTYRIVVDGYNGAEGDHTLTWTFDAR